MLPTVETVGGDAGAIGASMSVVHSLAFTLYGENVLGSRHELPTRVISIVPRAPLPPNVGVDAPSLLAADSVPCDLPAGVDVLHPSLAPLTIRWAPEALLAYTELCTDWLEGMDNSSAHLPSCVTYDSSNHSAELVGLPRGRTALNLTAVGLNGLRSTTTLVVGVDDTPPEDFIVRMGEGAATSSPATWGYADQVPRTAQHTCPAAEHALLRAGVSSPSCNRALAG